MSSVRWATVRVSSKTCTERPPWSAAAQVLLHVGSETGAGRVCSTQRRNEGPVQSLSGSPAPSLPQWPRATAPRLPVQQLQAHSCPFSGELLLGWWQQEALPTSSLQPIASDRLRAQMASPGRPPTGTNCRWLPVVPMPPMVMPRPRPAHSSPHSPPPRLLPSLPPPRGHPFPQSAAQEFLSQALFLGDLPKTADW